MSLRGIRWAFQLLKGGQAGFLLAEIWMRLYKHLQEVLFFFRFRLLGGVPGAVETRIQLETKHPVAFESPDHIAPRGTMNDNSTNKKVCVIPDKANRT
jgi:hypothetical protein